MAKSNITTAILNFFKTSGDKKVVAYANSFSTDKPEIYSSIANTGDIAINGDIRMPISLKSLKDGIYLGGKIELYNDGDTLKLEANKAIKVEKWPAKYGRIILKSNSGEYIFSDPKHRSLVERVIKNALDFTVNEIGFAPMFKQLGVSTALTPLVINTDGKVDIFRGVLSIGEATRTTITYGNETFSINDLDHKFFKGCFESKTPKCQVLQQLLVEEIFSKKIAAIFK